MAKRYGNIVYLEEVSHLVRYIKEAIELYTETLSKEEKEDLLRQKVVGIQKVKTLA